MKSGKTKTDRLERALIAAYGRGEKHPVSPGWQERVMRRIRQEETQREQENVPWLSPPHLWRFAASTCMAAAVVTAYALISGLSIESELANEVLGDFSLIIAQVLGLI
jgi:hypothetical protein